MKTALSFALLLVAACGSSTQAPTTPPAPPAPTGPSADTPVADPTPAAPAKPVTTKTLAAIGINPDNLDRTADPCDDFDQFACGGYIAKTEIPADKPRITSFDTTRTRTSSGRNPCSSSTPRSRATIRSRKSSAHSTARA
jgi:hypothetical protein